ncbi:hypothetical protein ACFV5G_39405 [Streptomyces sp. NPDC059766]|uniref:hypothetical protein n=1 Tax=Streptomyces sp. NPDC059766 TaxID=3346940 RepID=UPI0036660705
MNSDEETDEPTVGERLSADEAVVGTTDGAPSTALPLFSVVIAADGSAAIDGMPLPVTGGETVDTAILDTLHAYASRGNLPVTAAISDPAVADVTYVEVAPDGSSRIVERPPALEPAAIEAPVEAMAEPVAAGVGRDDVPPAGEGTDERTDDSEDAGEDVDRGAYPQPPPPARRTPVPGSLLRRPSTAEGRTPRQSDDEYRSAGLLHRPLIVGPVALGVAALVIVPRVITGGGSDDGGQQNTAAGASAEPSRSRTGHDPAGASTTPTATGSATPGPTPSATSTPPKAKDKPKHTSPGGAAGATATVTVRPPKATATVTAAPAKETAATVVNRLAADDPGRHICYRAYVSGKGWQKPVCDGTVAGTTGQNRAIKALDIAVRGTGGVAANAFVHNPASTDGRGVWKPHWTPNTADGKDIYIGSTAKGAPAMLGYAINIGSGGQVCQTAHVHDIGWNPTGCVGPRPAYIFGGTLDNGLWLEAVKFTV